MKRLFKFVGSASAAVNMAKGSLKFTPIDELNDPTEMLPVMDHEQVRNSLDELRRHGLNEGQFNWLRCHEAILDLLAPHEKVLNAPGTLSDANRMLSIAVYDDMQYMQRKLFSTIGAIRRGVGILSLSERYDAFPMWAHYANQAKGYAVVLDNLDQFFRGDNTGSLNVPKPVVYSDRFIGMTFDPCTQDRLFFSKLSDWSYEREWRVVAALSACRRSSDGGVYLVDMNPCPVASVICGWRVRADEVRLLRDELVRVNPSIQLISAVLDSGKIKLAGLSTGQFA